MTSHLSHSQLLGPTWKVLYFIMPPDLERMKRAEQVAGIPKWNYWGSQPPGFGNEGRRRISLLSLYLFCNNKGDKKMSHDITKALPANSRPCVSGKDTAVDSRLHLRVSSRSKGGIHLQSWLSKLGTFSKAQESHIETK